MHPSRPTARRSQCGDAACEGDENYVSCPLDCLATCGNRVCDGGEDRASCGKDCGYCGNGICEDAAESASLFPQAPLVTCLEDCVTSGCEQADDCNDGIFCTTGACSADGICQYTPLDALCPVNEKCIKFSGCCPDKDRDGFADAVCGGSDCSDDDPFTYPGAVEACGGGDRNCNDFHRPQLKPIKKVTNTTSYKSGLAMTWDGTRFWAACGTCAMTWDGETSALVCLYQDSLTFNRIVADGAALSSTTSYDTKLVPVSLAIAVGGLGAGDTTKIGILGTEGGNLVFVMRDVDGRAVVAPGAVGGGSNIANARLFWDGDAFQAYWLAKSGDIEQIFRTTITCE